jgi:hypothetical protein
MKSLVTGMLMTLVVFMLYGCGGGMQMIMQEPEAGKCIVVGAILVENNGVDDVYNAIKSGVIAVIVGRSMQNGEEVVEAYRIRTDENGYFFLPNVPRGSYVLKGIEVTLGYKGLTLFTSRWDGTRQIYYASDSNMIDHVVRSWPEENTRCVNDMGIRYFMVDPSMGIYANRFAELKDHALALKDNPQTMVNPENYYRRQYPDIKCFNE